MNDAFQITFGLLGGLAIFIFGMNMMSESLQKAAGEKMKKILGILTVNPVMGVLAGTIATAGGGAAEQQCHDGHGHRVRQCRADDLEAGHFRYSGSQYRDHDDSTASGI